MAEQSDVQAQPAHLRVSLSMTFLICQEIEGTRCAWEHLKVKSSPCCQVKNSPVKQEGHMIPPPPRCQWWPTSAHREVTFRRLPPTPAISWGLQGSWPFTQGCVGFLRQGNRNVRQLPSRCYSQLPLQAHSLYGHGLFWHGGLLCQGTAEPSCRQQWGTVEPKPFVAKVVFIMFKWLGKCAIREKWLRCCLSPLACAFDAQFRMVAACLTRDPGLPLRNIFPKLLLTWARTCVC